MTSQSPSNHEPETIISVDDVSFGYGDALVLESVSIHVEAGAYLGIVGPNGSGKSTLIDLMLGLGRPDEGSVALFGEPAHEFESGERLGYVAQDAADITRNMPVTVREVVEMGRYPRRLVGRFSEDDRRAIAAAMEQVGIAALAPRQIGRLSGGQRQRVFIARALASGADLLVLDEPTAGIDAESREAFYDLLCELNATGLTIVLIEHDISAVAASATKIACLNRQLYFHGDPDAFLEMDALSQAYGTDHVLGH